MLRLKLNSLIQTPLTTNTSETFPLVQSSSPTGVVSFWRTWRWWLPPAVIALALVLYFVDPFIGDWDGMDYTMLSLAGYPSSMALGRNLFIFGNHLLFVTAKTLFNVRPENAYLIFKYAVVAQAPLAVMACWRLASLVTRSVTAATISSLLIVFSPVFVLYSGQVMTDVPSVLILAVALAVHLLGIQKKNLWLILAGAGLMGLGMNLRETIGFYAPWLLLAPIVCGWKFGRREVLYVTASCLVFGILAFGWFAYWFLTDPYYRHIWYGWKQSMDEESSRHPVALANLRPFIVYLFITAPIVFISLPFAPIQEWRKRKLTPLFLLWLVGAFADALLFFNYSTSVNWRYFLTGLPGLAPLAGNWLLSVGTRFLGTLQRAFVAVLVVIAGFAITFSLLMRPI